MYSKEKRMKITNEFVSHRRTQYIINYPATINAQHLLFHNIIQSKGTIIWFFDKDFFLGKDFTRYQLVTIETFY